MTTAREVRQGDIVSFQPHPNLFHNVSAVDRLEVNRRVWQDRPTRRNDDPKIILLIFVQDGHTVQVFLPYEYPVTLDQHFATSSESGVPHRPSQVQGAFMPKTSGKPSRHAAGSHQPLPDESMAAANHKRLATPAKPPRQS